MTPILEHVDQDPPTVCSCCGEPTIVGNHSYNGTTYGCSTCGFNLNSDNRTTHQLNTHSAVHHNLCLVITKLRLQLEDTKTELDKLKARHAPLINICGKGG